MEEAATFALIVFGGVCLGALCVIALIMLEQSVQVVFARPRPARQRKPPRYRIIHKGERYLVQRGWAVPGFPNFAQWVTVDDCGQLSHAEETIKYLFSAHAKAQAAVVLVKTYDKE